MTCCFPSTPAVKAGRSPLKMSWAPRSGRPPQQQGLVRSTDVATLEHMLALYLQGEHAEVARLAPAGPYTHVQVTPHARVVLQVAVVSGVGIRRHFGNDTLFFVQLEEQVLLQDIHSTLAEHLSGDLQGEAMEVWLQWVHAGKFTEAHSHFLNSVLPARLGVEFQLGEQVVQSSQDTRDDRWLQERQVLRMTSPNLFTAAHALLTEDQDHLQTVPDLLLEQATEAVRLHREYLETCKGFLDEDLLADPVRQALLSRQTEALALQLTREHLLPELFRLDANLDRLFHMYTGESFMKVLPDLTFKTGNHGGWSAVSTSHKGALISLSNSAPDHPTLTEVNIELAFEDAEEEYVTSVRENILNVNLTRSLGNLMGFMERRAEERLP